MNANPLKQVTEWQGARLQIYKFPLFAFSTWLNIR